MVGLDTMHMESLSGDYIEKMTEQQLAQVVPGISVFYRVTPRHKLCIVKVSFLQLLEKNLSNMN